MSRSTSVLARRLPPSKPNRGNAQIYMAQPTVQPLQPIYREKATMSRRFDEIIPTTTITTADTPTDEASAMAAMFAASSEQWQKTQNQMATSVFSQFQKLPLKSSITARPTSLVPHSIDRNNRRPRPHPPIPLIHPPQESASITRKSKQANRQNRLPSATSATAVDKKVFRLVL